MLFSTFFIFSGTLFAQASMQNPIDYRVMQLLGVEDYRINQKFIQRLFSDQGYFLDGKGQPDLYKISKTLKQNGLLKLAFKQPMELEISFVIEENPQTFVSVLYDVLDAMGYYYFLVKQSLLDEKKFKFILSMNTEYAIDPVLLQEKLREYGYGVQGVERTNLSQWNYQIALLLEFKYPKASALVFNELNHKANLKGEYWYSIENGQELEIKSSNNVVWYPKIVFYDESLNILEIVSSQKLMRQIQKEIPKNTKFIKITDTYLPITIKNGLDVVLQ
ncbi:hypothetical protein BCM35_01195 [Helicobacter winghamensis]|uniref:Periplasmic protein n=1 Tax=Helicobacter winghamensis TaxID=157268 RepID=A0A2N3PJF3_9HELI|nr:hypothetical protein HWAG_00187 [Helicobacter winghamensis ATCC BAA-430]PKT78238.1 hypothetical protein BCM34_02905 [Helicobacter winghamensis]PKT78504.1 hypothetical protein BCM32_01670 [Helicobacter winghamensis]PKT78767.1 hypothetical protein BCM35_01195 [Helicobacter winghamensis]PKT80524.1 hypothetical protein BCM33_08090 [Helicobacter winghamensis]